MTTPVTTTAVIQFLSDWRIAQQGRIEPGGKLIIEYNLERLPKHQHYFKGVLLGDIDAHVKFHPGGRLYTGSVVEKVYAMGKEYVSGRGPCIGHSPRKYEVMVPVDANQVEMWFRGYYQYDSLIETWDSQDGKNYWFRIAINCP